MFYNLMAVILRHCVTVLNFTLVPVKGRLHGITFTPVRDKDLLRKVPIAYSFQCAQAVPQAYSRRNSMRPMPHKDS